jgi:hypothetical protein
MAKKVRVYVFKETAGIDEYRVFPGIVVLEKNDDLELVNVSGDVAIWKMPAGPAGPFSNLPVTESVGNKTGKTKKVLADASAQAVEYVVEVNGKKAKGNSDPVIIIDL